jgi:hypothetical protein
MDVKKRKEFYEKISFALIDKSISFSPKIPYELAAERSEADNSHLQNPFWRKGRESHYSLSPAQSGEGGIRTLDALRHTRSPSERTRPLCDLSALGGIAIS